MAFPEPTEAMKTSGDYCEWLASDDTYCFLDFVSTSWRGIYQDIDTRNTLYPYATGSVLYVWNGNEWTTPGGNAYSKPVKFGLFYDNFLCTGNLTFGSPEYSGQSQTHDYSPYYTDLGTLHHLDELNPTQFPSDSVTGPFPTFFNPVS